MTTVNARSLACGVAVLVLGAARPLHAQLEVGTWVRQPTSSTPAMTMIIEACCNGGRRLSYHLGTKEKKVDMTMETRLDGRDAQVLMNGKPSGESMAITRVDAHHVSTVLKMNGKEFATSKSTLSPDGKTLTSLNEYSSSAGGQPAGKVTEIWVKQ